MSREAIRYILTCVVTMLAFGILTALTGCATVPHADKPDVPSIVTVNKVVTATCINQSDVPPLPRSVGNDLNGNAVHDVSILAASLLDHLDYENKQAAIIKGCTN